MTPWLRTLPAPADKPEFGSQCPSLSGGSQAAVTLARGI